MRIETIDLQSPIHHPVHCVCCIGFFDGVHLGHQALIAKTRQIAEQYNVETGLITFDPDPWVPIKNMDPADAEHITTLHQKIMLAASYGIENVFILNFTKEMSQLSPGDFLSRVLGQIDLRALVCGFDFHYGYMGRGSTETLKQSADFEVCVVDEVQDEEGKISSTRISKLIEDGKIEEAEKLLGHPFVMEGIVIKGRHKGTSIGFPTANIKVSEEYLKPAQGVYACYIMIHGKKYRSMVNLGHNPTMNYRKQLSLEANILDFSQDIYGETVKLQFVKHLRDEKRFDSTDELIAQLHQDQETVRKLPL